jgi:hypothetical protein
MGGHFPRACTAWCSKARVAWSGSRTGTLVVTVSSAALALGACQAPSPFYQAQFQEHSRFMPHMSGPPRRSTRITSTAARQTARPGARFAVRAGAGLAAFHRRMKGSPAIRLRAGKVQPTRSNRRWSARINGTENAPKTKRKRWNCGASCASAPAEFRPHRSSSCCPPRATRRKSAPTHRAVGDETRSAAGLHNPSLRLSPPRTIGPSISKSLPRTNPDMAGLPAPRSVVLPKS